MYEKEVAEQNEKGFNKAVREAGFFTKDLDLGLFDPFKDVNDGVLLEDEDIAAEEEAGEEQGDDANVQADFSLFFFIVGFLLHRLRNYDTYYFSLMNFLLLLIMHLFSFVDVAIEDFN